MGQVIFVSPGVRNDGGGIEIAIGSDGKPHVVVVPPWDGPDTATAVNTIASVLNLASITNKPGLRSSLQNIAKTITESYSAELAQWVEKAPTARAGGAAGGGL